ncbi:MAG: OsmC family protein [Desulfuromonadaceae bacterium]|nr:OsmC family protein [Desulfuromonadaceae bacterium]
MWTYEIAVDWKDGKIGEIRSGGKPPVAVATPPEFGGPENIWTPEDLLASAVASCLMTSTLFFADRAKITLRSYASTAVATMEKTAKGLAITGVKVAVVISLENAEQADAIRKAVEMAEVNCPISTTLNCPVELQLTVE